MPQACLHMLAHLGASMWLSFCQPDQAKNQTMTAGRCYLFCMPTYKPWTSDLCAWLQQTWHFNNRNSAALGPAPAQVAPTCDTQKSGVPCKPGVASARSRLKSVLSVICIAMLTMRAAPPSALFFFLQPELELDSKKLNGGYTTQSALDMLPPFHLDMGVGGIDTPPKLVIVRLSNPG